MAPVAALVWPRREILHLPVNIVLDGKIQWHPERIARFWWHIWPEAVRELVWCGIQIDRTLGQGEVGRPPGREPVVTGLRRSALNLVVTDRLPMEWDQGRALAGVTTRYRGFHLCMIAWAFAHVNQVPFVATNTCVHEMLHALMLDIFEYRPDGLAGWTREERIDYYATRLWLLRDGRAIHDSARVYLERLQANAKRLGE
jgi:hypothetical protein